MRLPLGLSSAHKVTLSAATVKAKAQYLSKAKKHEVASVEVFCKAGVEIANMSAEDFNAWPAIA